MNVSEEKLLLGLVGFGIQGSLTPAMQEREAEEQGLRCLYQLLDLDRLRLPATTETLSELLSAAERMGFRGLNITYPCKQLVMPLLDEIAADATEIGAVNTVVFRDGRRYGYNTDCWGFAESLKAGLPEARMGRVVQLGAGGAGAATAHAVLALGAKRLTISDISTEKAQSLAASLCERFGAGRALVCADLAAELARADGLVHCTPTGMEKSPGLPLPAALLHAGLWVADIVYFPLETELIRAARKARCRTLTGGGMAVYQAVGAFQHFTGRSADATRMQSHFAELQARKEQS